MDNGYSRFLHKKPKKGNRVMLFNIRVSQTVKGHYEAFSPETGEVFVGSNARVYYPKQKGLMIALSRAGHTYPDELRAPKPEKAKGAMNDLTPEQILDIFEYAKSKLTDKPDGSKDFSAANKVAKDAGFSYFGSLSQVVKGIRWGQKTPEEKAEITAKAEARKAGLTESKDSDSSWDSAAANKVAQAHGFDRYRAVKRAAERGEPLAKAVQELCKIAAMKAVVSEVPAVPAKEIPAQKSGGASSRDELFAAIAAFKKAG